MADVEKIAAELRAGLDGVTRGPFIVVPPTSKGEPADIYMARNEDDIYEGWVGEMASTADAEHFALCRPENIRALLDELDRLRTALVSVRGMLEVEYHDDGRIACVAHESGGLREMVRLLDATLARALSAQVEERE